MDSQHQNLAPMNPNSDSETHTPPVAATSNRSFWQKLGGGSLSISLILHVVLLAIGVIWVFQIIPQEPAKVVDIGRNSGGGGPPASETKVRQKQVQLAQQNLARVVALGAAGIPLPEPEQMTRMISLGGPSTATLAHGNGGGGNGGGNGDGNGPGIGGGLAPGMSTGNGSKNPFGMASMDVPALNGVFYDFKQTRSERENAVSPEEVQKILNEFTTRGWRESSLTKYYQAKQTLIQTKLYIPMMAAELAPAAFDCGDKVKSGRWAVIYSGTVSPPRTGKYRFVGAGDDILVVRFNHKNVFDHGYYSGTMPVRLSGKIAQMKGEVDDPELKKMMRRSSPMEIPVKFYHYPTTRKLSNDTGGLAVGPEFVAEAGTNYPIEILISELPGGKFSGVLLIEEAGVTYEKAPGGSPILPVFRLDGGLPDFGKGESAPPIDPNGPVWKSIPGDKRRDI